MANIVRNTNQKGGGGPTVVIIGGGYGGTVAARALDDETDVLLVEPKDAFVHNVAGLRAAVKPEWAARLFIPYERLLRRGRVLRDRAERVESGRVWLRSRRELAADYLVLATGSDHWFPAKTDLDDSAEAARRYRAVSEQLAGAGRVLLLGAGPVGLELAGEILAEWPRKQVLILDSAQHILGDALGRYSDSLREEIRSQLEGRGARFVLGSPLVSPPPTPPGVAGSFTVTTQAGVEISADIWFRCYGARPVTGYLAGDLASARQADRLVRVTPELRVADQQTVFAVGDITSIPESKRASAAGRHAEVVAANIKALASGGGELSAYRPGPPAIVLPLGPWGGASQLPDGSLAGPEQTSQIKGADLMVDRFRALLDHTTAGSPQGAAPHHR